ncbi:MAG: hypothetical protein INR71_10925 [Terriglobus roseus]|nr:hypothetical protein [Terriglobus roseus]
MPKQRKQKHTYTMALKEAPTHPPAVGLGAWVLGYYRTRRGPPIPHEFRSKTFTSHVRRGNEQA